MKFIKALIGFLLIAFFISCSGRKFDSEDWKEWKESEANPDLRWQMHHDLLETYSLIGYTKEQLITLLGNPTNESHNQWDYHMGYTGTGINTGSLILIFREKKVVDIYVSNG